MVKSVTTLQREEIRSQHSEIRGQKARRTYDGAQRSNHRITADVEALQEVAEFVAHEVFGF